MDFWIYLPVTRQKQRKGIRRALDHRQRMKRRISNEPFSATLRPAFHSHIFLFLIECNFQVHKAEKNATIAPSNSRRRRI